MTSSDTMTLTATDSPCDIPDFRQVFIPELELAGEHAIQCAAHFKDHLYIGVTSYLEGDESPGLARILRYAAEQDAWQLCYSSPIESRSVKLHGVRRRLPMELGFHSMVVFQDRLYITKVALRSPRLLSSADGETFEESNSTKGFAGPLGVMAVHQGSLFAAPVGTTAATPKSDKKNPCVIYAMNDADSEDWQPVAEPSFGVESNQAIIALTSFADSLYASVGNALAGFQLWKTTGGGETPLQWHCVIEKGAQRYTLDTLAPAGGVFQEQLYIGTATSAAEHSADQAGAEILRIAADDKWELVMGTPRFSPVGLQIPSSTYPAGFGDPNCISVSRLVAANGILYAALTSEDDGNKRFQLWASCDGDEWQPVTLDAFNSAGDNDVRTLLPSPDGLLVAGTCTPAQSGAPACIWLSD